MPKIKTKRGAAKRFKATGSGKITSNGAYHRHILTKKSPKQKRNLRAGGLVDVSNIKGVKKLLPYL